MNLQFENLHNSDHFPLLLTIESAVLFPSYPAGMFDASDWVKYALLAKIASDVINNSVEAISRVIKINAAIAFIPLSKGSNGLQNKPWWNNECQQAQKKHGANFADAPPLQI
ncbi:hypothetical protein AVEN_8249-1 [Araneus ventricosus]|uniref:Endonuclease/exonuclease/phosphatase domain-containing protein n=1 Tax=Araneus ventricosus TaxID=182803 RepID=A0A4Y2L2L6_ARAVE|nr:hypothetical protein AVEN_8249-1 [Araneus ventricosus]